MHYKKVDSRLSAMQYTAEETLSRNSIQTIHTYFDTQLPYAYVHLITLMVSLSNLATAMKCGVVMANAWADVSALSS